MIATRYVVREIFQAMIVIVAILMVLVACNMFIHYLGVAATGAMLSSDVAKLIGMTLPRYLAMLMPVSFFLAVVFVAGKMFQDNELTSLLACGVGWFRLLKMLLPAAVLIAVVVGAVSLVVVPRMTFHLNQLTQDAAEKQNIQFIQPGRFVSLQGGRLVVYIGRSDLSKLEVFDLFVYRQQRNGKPEIVMAPFGYQRTDPKTGLSYIILENGRAYTMPAKGQRYQLVHFKQYKLQLKVPVSTGGGSYGSDSTFNLLQDYSNRQAQAELQWRLTLPLATLVLAIMGLAICYVAPRQSRYVKLIPAVLLFMLYFNLLTISKSLMESGGLPSFIGLWWVHLVFLGGSLAVLNIRERGSLVLRLWRKVL